MRFLGGILAWVGVAESRAAEDPSVGLDRRVPWNTSKVVGTPEPPLDYTVERVLTNSVFKSPLYTAAEPGTPNLLVVQQGGEKDRPSKILRVAESGASGVPEVLLEVPRRLVYGLTFHPGFASNGQLFVFSNGTTGETERTNRISRYTVGRTAPFACDPASEKVILEWRSAGHDGGDLAFGLDGTLFISTGDGTSDSDGWDSGQTLNDLLGSVLRIDVDHPAGEVPYSIPGDNPFIHTPGARGEIWAYGLRNPWRMTVDRKTGHLWVGNNGQDLYETAHFIRPGENYGWSVYEGSHPFYLNRRRGPTPIVAPTIEHHHSDARSLTGGVVYYGDVLPELNGVYVYGDYSTGRIWGGRHDGKTLTWHQELAATTLQIAGFGLSPKGELLIVDLGGGLNRLVRAPKKSPAPAFPKRLSETGLFASTAAHQPKAGVLPYSVNAPGWVDGAEVERFLALPGTTRITYANTRGWNFPDGAVLVQTLSLTDADGAPGTRRRVETRLMTRQDGRWAGYSYRWNREQTDAELVERGGAEGSYRTRDPLDPSKIRTQTWRFPSRSECLACHSRAVNFVLGLSEAQMNREHEYAKGFSENQLKAFDRLGLFTEPLKKSPAELTRLVDPYAPGEDLERRARSYLHANCSVCHVEAGGGNAKMQLEISTARDAMSLFGARPQHDTFGIANAMLIAPGAPEHSVLLQRLSRRGRGQMPPLVTSTVDERAVALFRQWIASLKPERAVVREWTMAELERELPRTRSGRSLEKGKAAFQEAGCIQCHRFHGDGGSVGPDLSGITQRAKPIEVLESILQPSKVIAPDYAAAEIETVGGETLTGRVESETPTEIVLRPAAAEDSVRIAISQIRRRGLSKISNMPAGMLNTLTEEQVLDLLAYLLSEANPESTAFKP